MARVLYSATMSAEGFIAGPGGWAGEQFVLAHEPPAGASPGIHFHTDLAEALAAAKAAAGTRCVNVLGAEVLERIRVDVEPIGTWLWFEVARSGD